MNLKSGYIDNPDWSKEKVKAVVDGAIKEGIYVIIDFHSHNIRLNEAKQFFTEMATTYGRYPNVIYEIFNEPDYESWDEVKIYSTEIISAIRKIDPDNIILVGSPHWDQDINIVADAPLTGFTNIMYTVHFYAATHKQELRDRCRLCIKKEFRFSFQNLQAWRPPAMALSIMKNGINGLWSEKNKISWLPGRCPIKMKPALCFTSQRRFKWQLANKRFKRIRNRNEGIDKKIRILKK